MTRSDGVLVFRVISPIFQMLALRGTQIQNKIVAAAARIGFTGGPKPVITRKAHCSRICSGRRDCSGFDDQRLKIG